MALDADPNLKRINQKDITELNNIKIELPKEEEEEGEEGGGDEEKKKKKDVKVDDGVPDFRQSSKVSLHSDKKVTEPLLTGDE